MANVVRQDIVQVGFDIKDGPLQKLNEQMNKLKKMLGSSLGDDTFEDLEKNAKKSNKSMQELDETSKKVKRSLKEIANLGLEKLKNGLKKVSTHLTTIAKKAAGAAFNGLKKIAGMSFKGLIAGVGAAATAIGKITYDSVQAFANFEQNIGGVQKLFGTGGKDLKEYADSVGKSTDKVKAEFDKLKKAENEVIKNANNSHILGFSANEYMETVTSFSASLITDLKGDTVKAAELSNMAIKDMADNANVFGTDLASVQQVYQGLAKNQYVLLDNLKLGYGGSKEGAQKLVKDAAKVDKSIKANDLSFSNMVKAINVIQKKMGVFGATENEAMGTVTGSLNMTKAAWKNLLISIGSGENLDQTMANMVSSVEVFGKNVIPVAERALGGIGTVVEKLSPVIAEKLPALAEQLLPPLIKAAVELTNGLVKALPSIVKTVFTTLADICKDQFPVLNSFFNLFADKSNSIAKFIPVLLGLVGAFMAFKKINSVVSTVSGIFGKGKGKGGEGDKEGNLFGGLEKFAKTKPTLILKGMLNLAIIMGGFTILAAAMAAVAPHIAKLSDVKSMIELIAYISVVGIVGTALAKMGEICGKIPVATVAKGLANMAIMLAGVSALFLLVGAVSLINFDLARIMEITKILAVLGTVATVLSIFGGIVGLIPVAVVALGLANMAIIMTGMSALLLLIGATTLLDFDYNKIIRVVKLISVLGTVGAILSVFAGIVGMIPVPVVLVGLTNMGLVLGGMSALIVAFGKLTEQQGFVEFIEKGGEILPKICNIIGEMAGSLVGGLAEGITNSLPKIGENIASFATSLKPMFTMFKGADMASIGTFFKSLGSFMLQMAGEGILSFFTGGTSFAELGTELNTFADNSKEFFTKVATFPENGFTNATKLFDCLAGMKSLPKEGGVVGWFTGGINYENLANGLGHLSSTKVIDFFHAVSELQQAGFDNATKLFDCLAGMKSLPTEGGVKGWFMGDINYQTIATGLGHLSSDGVKKFFTMVGALSPQTFDNVTALFNSLATIKELPKEGGWWDSITGEETSALSNIANELGSFGKNTESFFEQVNSLNLNNLNGLWQSLNSTKDLTVNISKLVDDHITDIVEKITDLPNKMAEGLKSSGDSLSTALVEIWKDAVTETAKPINKLIAGANWILKEFGSKKTVLEWTPYAKGTGGHKGGNALVNDGRGAELIRMPNGKTFIPKGRNVFIPNAPKGMQVLSAENTASLLGKKSPTFNYANGTFKGTLDKWSEWFAYISLIPGLDTVSDLAAIPIDLLRGDLTGALLNTVGMIPFYGETADEANLLRKGLEVANKASTVNAAATSHYADGNIDIWGFLDNEKGLIDSVKNKFVNYKGMSGLALNIGKGMVNNVSGEMSVWVKKLYDEFGALSLAAYDPSKGVNQWKSTVIRALKMEGLYSASNVARTLFQMQTESGGNPKAINLWDSNAKKGIPSKGLMQVIDPTFKAYARAGFNKNIYDPLSNILASIRYAVSRYGSLTKAYRGVGYANGGFANSPSIFAEAGPEVAIPLSLNKRKRALSLYQRTGDMLGATTRTPESDALSYSNVQNTENNTYSPVFNFNISGGGDTRATARAVKQAAKEALREMIEGMERRSPKLQEI